MTKKQLLYFLRTLSTNSAGLTMIEVISGIVFLSITLVMVAPIIALSSASRIVDRQTEQAQEVAQQEIERLIGLYARLGGIPAPNGTFNAELELGVPPVYEGGPTDPGATPYNGNVPAQSLPDINASNPVAAPSAIVTNRADRTAANQVFRFDYDGDGDFDYLVHSFRNAGYRFQAGTKIGQLSRFRIGVRVYSIAAAEEILAGNAGGESIELTLKTSLSDTRTRPLLELRGEVFASDSQISLTGYRQSICADSSSTAPSANCP